MLGSEYIPTEKWLNYLQTVETNHPTEKWQNYLQTVETDQMPHYVASDLGLHCLPITLFGVSRLQSINTSSP